MCNDLSELKVKKIIIMKKLLLFLILCVANPAFVGCSDEEQGAQGGSGSENKVATGTHEGHQWVDLGIGVKWATCNIGATTPEEYGDYFAWGEISPKTEYTTENSITYGRHIDEVAVVGNPSYDAARANWGGKWRLPSHLDMYILMEECSWISCIQEGHEGYKIVGPNGNSIFLPAAGLYSYNPNFGHDGGSLLDAEKVGLYWTSDPSNSNRDAYVLEFQRDYFELDRSARCSGVTIRPVLD